MFAWLLLRWKEKEDLWLTESSLGRSRNSGLETTDRLSPPHRPTSPQPPTASEGLSQMPECSGQCQRPVPGAVVPFLS